MLHARLLMLIFLASLPTGRAYAQGNFGKLGFEDMTDHQTASLWREADKLAAFEAGMNVCGRRSGIEGRIVDAIRPCVKQEAISKVLGYWKSRIQTESQFQHDQRFNKLRYCANADVVRLFDKYTAVVDNTVEKVRNLCTACQTTGVCR